MHEGREPLPRRTEEIGRDVVESAVAVHKALGPGLLESAYEACLAHELALRRRKVVKKSALSIEYGQVKLDAGYRVDLLVDGAVIVEVEAVDALEPIHEARLHTYLRLSGQRLGFLLNFNVVEMKEGVKGLVL